MYITQFGSNPFDDSIAYLFAWAAVSFVFVAFVLSFIRKRNDLITIWLLFAAIIVHFYCLTVVIAPLFRITMSMQLPH